jgi:hypothetical protein
MEAAQPHPMIFSAISLIASADPGTESSGIKHLPFSSRLIAFLRPTSPHNLRLLFTLTRR